jgi:hypothetical protein
MTTHNVYLDDVLTEYWNDEAKEVTFYNKDGGIELKRPYNAEETTRVEEQASAFAIQTARAELERATLVNSAPEELAALQEAILAAQGIADGDPWRQPQGAHDAYPIGAVVSHKDKTWESTVAANVWEPGVSGWLEAGPGIPDWVQPTGGHDAYPLGAEVWHVEKLWRSLVDANVWEPPTQWEEIVGAKLRKTLRRRP